VEYQKLKFIGVWVLSVVCWYLIQDIRRIFINPRWESPIEEIIMYTGLGIGSLTLILAFCAFKWKVSLIYICLAMLHFRITLGFYEKDDIFAGGKTPRLKVLDTLIYTAWLLMN
jgi:hypothetical protein